MSTALKKTRRRRYWAATVDDVDQLSRSARQLSRRSVSRISQPEVAERLADLKLAMRLERALKLKIADLVEELIGRHGLRAIDLARETGWRQSDISEMYATVRAFPPNARPAGAQFNHLLLAKRMLVRFPQLGFTPMQAYEQIRAAGYTQHRDVTRHFDRLLRQMEASNSSRRLLSSPADTSAIVSPIGRAFHARFQDVLPLFDDRSIQIFSLDPPYVFTDEAGGRMYSATSARSLSCDSSEPNAAVELVIDALRAGLLKMADGGVLLLWQPWQSLLPPIAAAATEFGWSILGPVIWDKGRAQPGRLDSPYAIQGEMLWVLHRAGDELRNFDGSSREMILQFSPVSFPGTAHRQVHCYEKPVELCDHLIRKHSRVGDIIFDACGCTGSMSVAAISSNRRWVYAESNAENHTAGSWRIREASDKMTLFTAE